MSNPHEKPFNDQVKNKLFIVAGEPSADVIGARFVRQLQQRAKVHLTGVGGAELGAVGLKSLFPMDDLSVMGFADVIARLPLLLWRIRQTVRQVLTEQPDLVLLIDSQVFSALVAKRLRKMGYDKPIILYVAPSVWAWKPERAPKLTKLYNEVLSVLPFEPAAMVRLGGPPTYYVGHPAVEHLSPQSKEQNELPFYGEVALLPGSRQGELKRHLPVFKEVVQHLAQHQSVSGFIVPTLPHLADKLRAEVATWGVKIEVISDAPERQTRLAHAVVALASAGTITLELALLEIPHIGTYVPDRWQMKAFLKANRPLISLANNVLGYEFVPEIIPGSDLGARLVTALEALLNDATVRNKQVIGFREIRRRMTFGEDEAGKCDAVERILTYLPTSH